MLNIMKTDKIEDAIFECYRRLFAASEPPADFDTLYSEYLETGKPIPFMLHEISETETSQIIDRVAVDYKIPKNKRNKFKNTIILGYSPKYKY